MEKILDKKEWYHASAYISVDAKSGKISVIGIGAHAAGPKLENLATIPESLRAEIIAYSEDSEKSLDLAAFCDSIWKMAKKKDLWFA